MRSTAANLIIVHDEEDKENSATITTTLESECSTEPQITENSSIRVSTRKCVWLRIQDFASLNLVCVCIWYIMCVLYAQE